MKRQYTAVISKDDKWWIGWIEEVPGVNAQARTRKQLLVNLKECLEEVLQANRQSTLEAIGDRYETVCLTV